MITDTDPLMEVAKSMNDVSRSGSNYGKIFLLNEIIVMLENMKTTVKKDIKKENKFPDPYLDKL